MRQRQLFPHPNHLGRKQVEVTPEEAAERLREVQRAKAAKALPSPPGKETRNAPILVRLSPSERDKINAAAEAAGLSQQAYLLKRLLD